MVVFSPQIDESLCQRREWLLEYFIKGIPIIRIDPTLKIEEREEQIVDAFCDTHSRCSIWSNIALPLRRHNWTLQNQHRTQSAAVFSAKGPFPRAAAPNDAP